MRLSFEDLKRRKEEREAAEREGKVPLDDVFEEIRQEWREQHGCPLDEELVAYFDITLQFRRRLTVWWHVRRCPLCRADLLTLREAALAVTEYQPQPRLEATAGKFATVTLAVALLLSIFVASYEWSENRRLRQTINQQAATEKVFEDLAASMRSNLVARINSKAISHLAGIDTGPVMRERTFDNFLALGRAFMYAEQFDEAIPLLERAKQIRPDHDEPYKALAAISKMKATHEKSILNLEALLQRQPQDGDAWNFLGWSYFSLGKYEKSREAYERALQIHPDYADALFNLALVERQQGNNAKYQELIDKTRQLIHREISAHPDSAIAYFHLAKTYAHEQNWDQTLSYLKIAVAKDPDQ